MEAATRRDAELEERSAEMKRGEMDFFILIKGKRHHFLPAPENREREREYRWAPVAALLRASY